MICPNCGNNVEENAKFCENCGTNIESINQNIQTETNQLTNENVQPMNNQPVTENIQPEKSQEIKTNKKNNTVLVIIAIILIIVLGLLVYFFVIKKNNNQLNTNNNKSETSATTSTTITTTKNNQINNENPIKIDLKEEYNLDDFYKKRVNQYLNPIKETKIVIKKTEEPITYVTVMVNDNKEVEIVENNNTTKININGEKAKYLAGIKYADSIYKIAILTEEENIYMLNIWAKETIKIETQYKFNNFVVIDYMADTYNKSFFPYYPNKGSVNPDALIGITKNNEYIYLNDNSKILYLGKNENFLLGQLDKYQEEEKQGEPNSFMLAYSSIYVYSNGELNYVTAKTKFSVNENNYTGIFNQRNVRDENNNIIKARLLLKNENGNVYAITLDNQIYEIINNSESIVTKKYNSNKVKSINISEKKYYGFYNSITINQITYSDGTTENLDATGILIFE